MFNFYLYTVYITASEFALNCKDCIISTWNIISMCTRIRKDRDRIIPEFPCIMKTSDRFVSECYFKGCFTISGFSREFGLNMYCLLYTSDAADDLLCVDL